MPLETVEEVYEVIEEVTLGVPRIKSVKRRPKAQETGAEYSSRGENEPDSKYILVGLLF